MEDKEEEEVLLLALQFIFEKNKNCKDTKEKKKKLLKNKKIRKRIYFLKEHFSFSI